MLLNCGAEETLASPFDCKEILPVHPKVNQSRVFIGRTDAEAETPILWPPDGKNWLIWKDPSAGKDWRREEDETEEGDRGWDGWMASPTQRTWVWVNSGSWWWTGKPGVLQSMGHKELDTTELNWTELSHLGSLYQVQQYKTSQSTKEAGLKLRFWLTE